MLNPLVMLFQQMKDALARHREPARQRYVTVSTRHQFRNNDPNQPMLQGVKGGKPQPRILQRVMDLRNVKPREQRKGKPWRHNETTSARLRWLREHAGLA